MSQFHPLVVQCPRCGQEQSVERASRFREEDYYELWHEYAELEQEHRREVARLEQALNEALTDVHRLKFLVEHLEVPTLEQIELQALRGQLASPLPDIEPEEAADELA